MRILTRFGLLFLITAFMLTPQAWAQGECQSEGSASAELDVANVRAALYNNGNLFYASRDLYEVPKGGGHNSVFASGIWIGGEVSGQLRMAAATYSDFEFRPGPLFADGTAPTDCAPYDRLFKVNKTDIQAYEATGALTADLRDWPVQWGAPVIDGDGVEGNYNLAGGDRPEILGDQSIWWVMNDVSAPHNTTNTPPIGLEAKVLAFAFNQSGALGNTTFYRYTLTYRGSAPLENTYLGIWSDPDLGGAGDDYVGSDSTLGLGFVYNGNPTDSGYGDAPPALGYDFFQGPLVEAPGETWTDPDGTVHENATRLGMQKFVFYNNDRTNQGNPENAQEYYGYLRGFWRDGVPITFGGTGRGFSNEPASYMYPADPPEFWSEFNIDGEGTAIAPSDRRFIQSVGPFTMQPGETQEIVFGIVWSQDEDARGTDEAHLASVAKLKQDDLLAQQVFDLNFQLPDPPDAPRLTATELDKMVILSWDYPATSNNYLGRYSEENPLISDVPDVTFDFEGFILWRRPTQGGGQPTIVKVYDKTNGVGTILVENPDGTSFVDVKGPDAGLAYGEVITGLTNYTEYDFGIQAYAYNEFSSPKTYKSPINWITVVPSKEASREGGLDILEEAIGMGPDTVMAVQAGQGSVTARVLNPGLVKDASYEVSFYNVTKDDGEGHTFNYTVYDITNLTSGVKLFDGEAFLNQSCTKSGEFDIDDCKAPPQGPSVFTAEGLVFDILGPDAGPLIGPWGWEVFLEIVGPGGSDPCAEGAASRGGCADFGGNLVEISFNSTAQYVMYHVGPAGAGDVIGNYAPNDFEIRFGESSYAVHPFTAAGSLMEVPFTIWDIGPETPSGENDPSDDVQLIPNLFADNGGECEFDFDESPEDEFGLGWTGTERIYAYYPTTTYADFAAQAEAELAADLDGDNCVAGDGVYNFVDFGRGRPLQRQVLFGEPGLTPEDIAGTVIRFSTTKPNLPGDTFTLEFNGVAPVRDAAFAAAALDEIGIVPNPYRGASDYEVTTIQDEVRFTNMPPKATIRVFTLNGTHIRTLEKDGPEAFLAWDLQTKDNLPVASGMYLIHVDVPGVGEKVLKFGVVKKRVFLNEL